MNEIEGTDLPLSVLEQHSVIWIKFGGENLVLDDINRVFIDSEKKRLSVQEITEQLATRFADLDKPRNYWELVADSTLRKSEILTEMSQYQRTPPRHFVYVARIDNRTSQICRLINGKTVNPTKVFTQMNAYIEASSKNDVDGMKKAWPWHTVKEGSTQLPEGTLVPPLHGRCRTVLIPQY